jgi:hypothetical protein
VATGEKSRWTHKMPRLPQLKNAAFHASVWLFSPQATFYRLHVGKAKFIAIKSSCKKSEFSLT